jgi:GNAT superfamily N-acetyltransferase
MLSNFNIAFRALCESNSDMKFQVVDMGLGLKQFVSKDMSLVGGMRSGNSGPGETRLKYFIYIHDLLKDAEDQDDAKIGFVELFVKDGTDDIMGLVNIEIDKKFRGKGYGEDVVKTIVYNAPEDLRIHDMQKKAHGFWDKMGVEYENNTGKRNGVIKKV